MDLSLDEIIKKKRIGGKSVKKGFITKKQVGRKAIVTGGGGGLKSGGIAGGGGKAISTKFSKGRIVDARNKIIQKNRAKIRDAREKLAQITKASGDARLRLQKKRKDVRNSVKTSAATTIASGGGIKKNILNKGSNNFTTRKMNPIKPKLKQKLPPKLHQLVNVPHGYVDYDNMEVEEGIWKSMEFMK